MNKAAYVLRARQTRNHTCHWPGCGKQVPPAMWGCSRHWFMLPKRLRDAIWKAYKPGQENLNPVPSQEYLKVAADVRRHIEEIYGEK